LNPDLRSPFNPALELLVVLRADNLDDTVEEEEGIEEEETEVEVDV
jgi:hypothetical protein